MRGSKEKVQEILRELIQDVTAVDETNEELIKKALYHVGRLMVVVSMLQDQIDDITGKTGERGCFEQMVKDMDDFQELLKHKGVHVVKQK